MILSHEHRLIFLHSRKTAGSSITASLNRYLGPNDIQLGAWSETIATGGRYNRRALTGAFSQPLEFVSRSIVRSIRERRPALDPFAVNKIQKAHFKNKHGFNLAAHTTAKELKDFDPEAWAKYYKFCVVRNPWAMVVSDYYWRLHTKGYPSVSFDEFVRRLEDTTRPDPEELRPPLISNWDIYTIDDVVAVDFVARFERLAEDLEKVSEKVGLPINISSIKAKGKQRDRSKSISDHYNDDLIETVGRVFAKEVQEFGYQPPV